MDLRTVKLRNGEWSNVGGTFLGGSKFTRTSVCILLETSLGFNTRES